jgi:hypothetical protein
MQDKITVSYLHELQAIYHKIDKRGICVDKERLKNASAYIDTDILKQCNVVSSHWGLPCYIGSGNKPDVSLSKSINLYSSSGDNSPLAYL